MDLTPESSNTVSLKWSPEEPSPSTKSTLSPDGATSVIRRSWVQVWVMLSCTLTSKMRFDRPVTCRFDSILLGAPELIMKNSRCRLGSFFSGSGDDAGQRGNQTRSQPPAAAADPALPVICA